MPLRTGTKARYATHMNVDTFYKSKFMKLETYTAKSLSLPLLSNNLHPLLSKVDHHMPASLRPCMAQSLRLASHILQCGALDSFFYTFQSVPRKWQNTDDPDRFGWEFAPEDCDPSKELTPWERSLVQQRLIDLADYVAFQTIDDPNHGAYLREVDWVIGTGLPKNTYPGAWGEKSAILISRQRLDELRAAYEAEQGDFPCLLYAQFDLAITLVHELAHAYRNLMHGMFDPEGCEPFFGDSVVAEVGFELEKRLFGGRIERLWPKIDIHETTGEDFSVYCCKHGRTQSKLAGRLVIWEYPYQILVNTYAGEGNVVDMDVRQGIEELRELDLAWKLPVSFFQQFFDDGFWQAEYAEAGLHAFRPEKGTGVCFKLDKSGRHLPTKGPKAKNEEWRYVPVGYNLNKDTGFISADPTKVRDGRVNRKNVVFSSKEQFGGPIRVLTNDLHPIFRKASDDLRLQEMVMEEITVNIQALEPSFRLASHFLTCGVLDSFFYTFHNPGRLERFQDRDNEEYDVVPAEHCRADVSLTDYQRARVQERLRQLAENVEFNIDARLDDGVRTTELREVVKIKGIKRGSKQQPVRFGFRSFVRFGQEAYESLEQIIAPGAAVDLPNQLALQFEFAAALVHEVAHIYRNFMIGGYSNQQDVGEPFLGDSTVAELGFELEKRLFGGHITRVHPDNTNVRVYRGPTRPSTLEGILCVLEWPYQQIVYGYEDDATDDDPNAMPVRINPNVIRPLDQAWRIHLSEVSRLFDDNFWATNYPNNRGLPDLLWPQKWRGFNFLARKARRGITRGPQPVSNSNDDQRYVPLGYRRKARGDIRPNAGVAAVRSPIYPFANRPRRTRAARQADQRIANLNPWTRIPHPGRWHTQGRSRLLAHFPADTQLWRAAALRELVKELALAPVRVTGTLRIRFHHAGS
ncbi:hypothetical protein AC579_5611 [Pseudocercospora musae]|uniref:Uncharacterized protein n=1 Tax=Pseudocercospora musae TaxID=113226 RepID=A0A139I146_9PEZI|nr:hypothetical protein AC579_5611 [Pseudocercospora musae]